MTEAEWLACEEPDDLLLMLCEDEASDRKARSSAVLVFDASGKIWPTRSYARHWKWQSVSRMDSRRNANSGQRKRRQTNCTRESAIPSPTTAPWRAGGALGLPPRRWVGAGGT